MASGRQFGTTNGPNSARQKRFSIDDAFEEETDEAIKVYGATTTMSPVGSVVGVANIDGNNTNSRNYRLVNDGSRDSDSLIQDFYDGSHQDPSISRSCFRHPKVRENWRMVLAATTLLVIGLGLLGTGILALAEPQAGLQGAVFLIAGFICFVPGAYHVVYIYLAAKGRRGYHFHNLPLFT
ncbi:transmembrane protein 134 [Onthophagus taurus]|uniref:transmembrane protein 134 n=1 Tax=Onthophagus taurus TaxID=166361 RepID=UPI000C20CE33|nr:transmembrane protein 134 [Onthophagus taurus]